MNKIILILLLLLCFLASSCKKCDNGDRVAFWNNCPSAPQNPVPGLLKRTWKVSKVMQVGQAAILYQNPLPSGQSNYEDYSRYRLTFTDNTYRITERDGVTTTSGNWELDSNNKKIILDKGVTGKERVYDVESIESDLLKLRHPENSQKTGNRDLIIDLAPE